ncbi:MAG TPA: WD40 repeat domain-containing protein, partial [Gemmataceae bacterium]|nr:WD40 repeat domain-containing protein [Gemmataceae bacterium]
MHALPFVLQTGSIKHRLGMAWRPLTSFGLLPAIWMAMLGLMTTATGCGRPQRLPPRERATLSGHTGGVCALAVTADGKTLASASEDNTVRIWDLVSEHERFSLRGHTDKVVAVAISPDGKTAVSGGWDSKVKVWDLTRREELASLETHTGRVRAVAITPDGKTAISGSEDSTIKLWDVPAKKRDPKKDLPIKERLTLTGHTFSVTCLAISQDGKTLGSGGQGSDRTIKIWNLPGGTLRASTPQQVKDVTCVALSPDAQVLASGGLDLSTHLWDAFSGQSEFTLEARSAGTVWSVAFSPDGKTLATAHANGAIKLWDLATRQEYKELRGHADHVDAVLYLPDGKTLVSASSDRTIKL